MNVIETILTLLAFGLVRVLRLKVCRSRTKTTQMKGTMNTISIEPEIDGYIAGAILESSWGYDQTNIDYFRIVKRTPSNLFLIPLNSVSIDQGGMRGTSRPGEPMKAGDYVSCVGTWDGKPIRRKLCRRDGKAIGCSIIKHGWANLWDGTESHWTAYA